MIQSRPFLLALLSGVAVAAWSVGDEGLPPVADLVEAAPGWYRGELWGALGGTSCLLAFTSPIYAVDSD